MHRKKFARQLLKSSNQKMKIFWVKSYIRVFPNYEQRKVGISVNRFFPFGSFVMVILVTHKFGEKYRLIFELIIRYLKNRYVKVSPKMKLKQKRKMSDLLTLPI